MYIKRMKKICHLSLDTSKYSSHTTGTDVLFAGIPLLTLPQDTIASRVGASLIHSLGSIAISNMLVALNITEYEKTAIALATNKEKYENLKDSLQSYLETGALFDDKKWVKNWEKALFLMWEKLQHKLQPESIWV